MKKLRLYWMRPAMGEFRSRDSSVRNGRGGWWELHGWTSDWPGRQMAAWSSSEEKDIGLVARGLSQGALLGVGLLCSVYDVTRV